jgi:prepilin-type N-terminal cleavage/methylation domain-containing protein
MHPDQTQIGFTLVELLVVVTIVVVLLALLAPALDKAIYQAELVRCGAQQKGVANGANIYAVDFNRSYPDRQVFNRLKEQPLTLAQNANRGQADDRPMLRTHLDLRGLIEPLSGSYPIAPEETAGYSWVFSGFELWFSAGYPNHPWMQKLGQRFSWTDDFNYSPGRRLGFKVLVSDFDFVGSDDRNICGHPDADGIMAPLQSHGPGNFFTRWEDAGENGRVRGPVDLNYAYADGSVLQLSSVEVNDERIAAVPYMVDALGWATWRVQLPRD